VLQDRVEQVAIGLGGRQPVDGAQVLRGGQARLAHLVPQRGPQQLAQQWVAQLAHARRREAGRSIVQHGPGVVVVVVVGEDQQRRGPAVRRRDRDLGPGQQDRQ
jgi:hypothetical protein